MTPAERDMPPGAVRNFSNVVGFDDAPFDRDYRGGVSVVGAVFAGPRFDGVLVGEVEKDGTDAAARLADLIAGSRFREHIRLVLLQGVTLAGFNVVDVFALHDRLGIPVLVVARKRPDMAAVREALVSHIPGGAEKWAILERLGEMEPAGHVHVQRVGLTPGQASSVVRRFAIHSRIPEPLRAAHMIATAIAEGQSRGQP